MRLCVLAASERGPSSSVDAALLDGSALAAALEREGHDVELLGLPAHDDGWLNRSVAALETAGALLSLALMRPAPDAVLMVAPPNTAALCADFVAGLRQIPGAVVLTSLMTEARMRTGEFGRDSFRAMILPVLEAALVRRARVLVVPTEALRRRVLLRGANASRVALVRELFAPLVPAPEPARVARMRGDLAEGADCLVVLPAALGASTDLGALMGALTRLKHDHSFAFAAIGGGSRAATLRDMIRARDIRNAAVVQLSRADRRAAVHCADVLLGIAMPAHDGLCVPRALSRALWAGKPLVAVGLETSELVREVRHLGIGACVALGDGDGLATALRSLATDEVGRRELAQRALEAGMRMSNPIAGLLAALSLGGTPGLGLPRRGAAW
jgi:hypothetical protein